MNPASRFRIELCTVIVPLAQGDEVRAMVLMRHSVVDIGKVVGVDVKPYAKPAGSHVIRVEVDCVDHPQSIVENLVQVVGGPGWILSGSGDEIDAIWSPHEGALPRSACSSRGCRFRRCPRGLCQSRATDCTSRSLTAGTDPAALAA